MLAQCAVQPGLSHVYDELLLQGAGSEIYMRPLAPHKHLHGAPFGHARRCFARATVIGITGPSGTTLAPSDAMILGEEDALILIADKEPDTKPGRPRAPKPVPAAAAPTQAAPPKARPKSLLLLNLDESMPDLVRQIDEVLPAGSKITLLAPSAPHRQFSKLHHAHFRHVRGDPTNSADLRAAGIENFDAVVCLQPGGGSDADDSGLLVSLLGMKQAVREAVGAKGAGADADGDADAAAQARVPRVISEVHSPSMLELLRSRMPTLLRRSDFVLPSELSSGILVQFALQPQLKAVYNQLLQPDGPEFFLSPAEAYADLSVDGGKTTFEALAAAARSRGEVAIGIYQASGDKPMLNPPRSLRLQLKPGDRLVVLGEAF